MPETGRSCVACRPRVTDGMTVPQPDIPSGRFGSADAGSSRLVRQRVRRVKNRLPGPHVPTQRDKGVAVHRRGADDEPSACGTDA